MTARAAKGSFPYPHRTVAEVDAAEADWERKVALAKTSMKGPCGADRRVGLHADLARNGLQNRSTLPDAPCTMCGARGWCDHRKAAA